MRLVDWLLARWYVPRAQHEAEIRRWESAHDLLADVASANLRAYRGVDEKMAAMTRTTVTTPPHIMIATDFKRGMPCS